MHRSFTFTGRAGRHCAASPACWTVAEYGEGGCICSTGRPTPQHPQGVDAVRRYGIWDDSGNLYAAGVPEHPAPFEGAVVRFPQK